MAHLQTRLVCDLDARKGHARGVSLREGRDHDNHLISVTREVIVAPDELPFGTLGTWRYAQIEHDLEANFVCPIERLVHQLDALHEWAGLWPDRSEDVPGNRKSHGIEPSRGNLSEVGLRDEGCTMLRETPVVLALADGRDERGLVEHPRPREERGGNPSLQGEPASEIHAMQGARRHRTLQRMRTLRNWET